MRFIFIANEMLTLSEIFSNLTNYHLSGKFGENRGKSKLVKNNRGKLGEPG